jgi:hypothetical protein
LDGPEAIPARFAFGVASFPSPHKNKKSALSGALFYFGRVSELKR